MIDLESLVAELFVSYDCEADGPIPGVYSMISFAGCAFTLRDGIISEFTRNLFPLEEAQKDPDTMNNFWSKHPQAYQETQIDQIDPDRAMQEFSAWAKSLPGGQPVFAAYPMGFDFTFHHWYSHRFLGSDPFGFSGFDLKSYAMASLKLPYRNLIKKNMPRSWFDRKQRHTHVALDDAREQAFTMIEAMKSNLDLT